MKLCFHTNPSNPIPNTFTIKLKRNALSIYTIGFTLFFLISVIVLPWGLNGAHAQNIEKGQTFKIIVQVTNNGNLDEHGTIHVSIDGSRSPIITNNLIFPGFQTSSYPFSFSSGDVPVGKGFSVEVIYGDDDIKRVYGTNTPSNSPEIASLTIP